MYIRDAPNIKTIVVNERIGDYLVKKNIPLLSRDGKKMIFSDTKEVSEAMKSIPIHLKLMRMVRNE